MVKLPGKLKELESNVQELESFRQYAPSEIRQDRKLRWALRYGLLESIQRVRHFMRSREQQES